MEKLNRVLVDSQDSNLTVETYLTQSELELIERYKNSRDDRGDGSLPSIRLGTEESEISTSIDDVTILEESEVVLFSIPDDIIFNKSHKYKIYTKYHFRSKELGIAGNDVLIKISELDEFDENDSYITSFIYIEYDNEVITSCPRIKSVDFKTSKFWSNYYHEWLKTTTIDEIINSDFDLESEFDEVKYDLFSYIPDFSASLQSMDYELNNSVDSEYDDDDDSEYDDDESELNEDHQPRDGINR